MELTNKWITPHVFLYLSDYIYACHLTELIFFPPVWSVLSRKPLKLVGSAGEYLAIWHKKKGLKGNVSNSLVGTQLC